VAERETQNLVLVVAFLGARGGKRGAAGVGGGGVIARRGWG